MRYLALTLLFGIVFCYGAASFVNFTLLGHVFVPKEQEINFTIDCVGKEFETYYECYNYANLTIATPNINTFEVYHFIYYLMHSNISLEKKKITIEVDGEAPKTTLNQDWQRLVNFTCTDRSGCAYTIFKIGNQTYNVTKPFHINCSGVCILEVEYYSVDIYGNREKTKTGTIKIDNQPPYVLFFVKDYYKPGWIEIPYKVEDASGFSHFVLNGKNTTTIKVYATKDQLLEIKAVDKLNNTKDYSVEIKVDGDAPIIKIKNSYCPLNCKVDYEIVERSLANVSEEVKCDQEKGNCVICVYAIDKAGNSNKSCKEVEYIYKLPKLTYLIGQEIKANCSAALCDTYMVTNEGNFSLPYKPQHSIFVKEICASNPNGVKCEKVDKWIHPRVLTGYFIMPNRAYGFAILALLISLILALLLWRFK